MHQIWDAVLQHLEGRINSENLETWIRPLRLSALGKDRAYLVAPNRFYVEWVESNFLPELREALHKATGTAFTLRFEYDENEPPSEPAAAPAVEVEAEEPLSASPPTPTSPGVHPDKTFRNFVVGASNQFAQAAAQAVAEAPGHPQYNPLFIYGSTGLGKTHLLHAIGNTVLQRDPHCQILYTTAEKFTNELIEALRFKNMSEFRDRYRKVPSLLLMDDVQFLTGKERTQEELFHTFEWLRERGKQIVFTADVLPREIKGLEPRLRTRCESGMLADMQAPDVETLVAIIQQKASDGGMNLPPELCNYIGARVRGNIREVEGILNRLSALVRLHRQAPTLEFARQHLGGVLADSTSAPNAEDIIRSVADFYNIKVGDLKGDRRLKQLVRPRHVAMWMVRKHTELSFPEIGRVFDRDHATVQHACKKVADEMERDVDLRNTLTTLARNLGL
jgi:chromosomal replication initiator protein